LPPKVRDMPAIAAERFLDALRQSGLLTAARLDAQVRRSAAEGPPEDARELAARFVRDGLLTPFQADRLLQGKWQSLVIAGKYAILAPLGAGGMGQVFLAEHTMLRRRSAIKILPARLMADPAAVGRFNREARAVASLDHPNIVRAYDVDTADDLHFLVMEYVDGVSLQELVGRLGPVEPAAAANYIAQAARGLQHAHEGGWVHRDVKPANLLLDRSGIVKVLDLGLARLLAEDSEPLTGLLDAIGTADYLAPEQADDSHGVDIRADIYSLGATLYFLLSGKPPFSEGTPAQRVLGHQTRPPRPIRDVRPEVPPGLARVVVRMLAKDPAGRYPEPAAVSEALEPWAGGGAAFPPPPDFSPTGSSGGLSGPISTWARHAGSSSSKGASIRKGFSPPVAADTRLPDVTRKVSRKSRLQPMAGWPARAASRRWLIAAGACAAAVMAIGAYGLWPKMPMPDATVVDNVEPVGEVQKFVGHEGAIENLAFTSDGKRLITVSQDKTARVWDVATGRQLGKLEGHTAAVRGLVILPDGFRAVTAGWDGTVRLWDLDSGKELRQFVGHKGEVWWVTADAAGKKILTGGKDRTARLWDIETGQQTKQFTGHIDIVTAALFLPDGRRAVTASTDRSLRLWDITTGQQKGLMPVPKMVYRLSLSADGRWVVFGCDKDLTWWDPDGSLHRSTIPGSEPVEGGVMLADGRLVVAMLDGTIRMWDVTTDREVHKFDGNGQAVLALAIAPDGEHVASGGRDKIARLWRLPAK
jgi:eukaryotic-like serine/threonine-protein kinase